MALVSIPPKHCSGDTVFTLLQSLQVHRVQEHRHVMHTNRTIYRSQFWLMMS